MSQGDRFFLLLLLNALTAFVFFQRNLLKFFFTITLGNFVYMFPAMMMRDNQGTKVQNTIGLSIFYLFGGLYGLCLYSVRENRIRAEARPVIFTEQSNAPASGDIESGPAGLILGNREVRMTSLFDNISQNPPPSSIDVAATVDTTIGDTNGDANLPRPPTLQRSHQVRQVPPN